MLMDETHISMKKYIIFSKLDYNKLYREQEMNRLTGTPNAVIQFISEVKL